MLKHLRGLYEENLFESVIPFWMKHSLDRACGGYFTFLDREGAIYDSRKYVWLNGRQVWTLARLYNEVAPRREWLDAARLGAEFLRDHAFDPEGRCYFSLTREGQPSFFQRKPYAAAFVALGFAEYAKATGDATYHVRALELFANVQAWVTDPTALGRPTMAGGVAYSQLADIYVICSLALELQLPNALPWCLSQIGMHYEPSRQLLYENAAINPALQHTFPEGRLICAGSIFEISWFLFRAMDVHPNPKVEAMLLRSIEGAMDSCWDREHGGFFYFVDIDERPMLQLESDMKLWWVHVEAIYALLCAHERTREDKWLTWAEQVHEYTWKRFPDRAHGEWFGYLHRDGTPSNTLKGNNYKGCFHIPRALLFSAQLLERLANRGAAAGLRR